MIQSQAFSRWSLQSSYTRVATSVSFAVALMVAFYYLVSYGPNLVDAHSALLNFFETDKAARTGMFNFVIWGSLATQVVLALSCARVGTKLKGNEKLMHSGLALLWVGHALLLFLATLVMGLAMYDRSEVAALESPNAALFGQLCVFTVIFLFAYLVPMCSSSADAKDNPMFALAMGKLFLLGFFALFVPTKVTLTLLVGSYLLDFLLHPVGEKIRETTSA